MPSLPARGSRLSPQSRGILNGAAQTGYTAVLKQLVIRPFWAGFDLRDRPPVYKAAALPIELRRHPHRRLAQDFSRERPESNCGPASPDPKLNRSDGLAIPARISV